MASVVWGSMTIDIRRSAKVQKNIHTTLYMLHFARRAETSQSNITTEESNTFGDNEFKLVDALVIPNNLPIVLLFSLVLIDCQHINV